MVFFYAHDTSNNSHRFYDNEILPIIKNPTKKISPQFYKFIKCEKMYFGQAVYIPLRVLKIMTGVLRSYYKEKKELIPTDALLSLSIISMAHSGWAGKIDAYVTLPHPIQHRHARNGRELENEGSDDKKYSLSFERGLDIHSFS